jgi:mono/diheme cytochrome c family protein
VVKRAAIGVSWTVRFFCLACTLAVLLILAGCADSESKEPAATPVPTATGHPAKAASGVADTARSPVPTRTPVRVTGSTTNTAADVAEGMVLVQAQCAWCHALAAAGLSSAQAAVGPPLDNAGVGHSRTWLSAALVNACAHHKATSQYSCAQKHNTVAVLTAEQREQIVSYLLTLKGFPTPVR